MPICKKCNIYFKSYIKINGLNKVLSSRKFCLTCSPYGGKNRRNLCLVKDNLKLCYMCKTYKDYSEFSKQMKRWDRANPSCKTCSRYRDNYLKYLCKIQCIQYKGGKCIYCGYNECPAAMEFHHRDPKTKEFAIFSKRYFNEKIKQELDKCDLVCSNCHHKIHWKFGQFIDKVEKGTMNN